MSVYQFKPKHKRRTRKSSLQLLSLSLYCCLPTYKKEKSLTFRISLAKKFCLPTHRHSVCLVGWLLLSPSRPRGPKTSTFLNSLLVVCEFLKIGFVLSNEFQQCGRTKDLNSFLNSTWNQSHANGLENHFHQHCSQTQPSTPLPSSKPGCWDLLLFALAPAHSFFTYVQTPEQEKFQKDPPIKAGRKVTGRVSCLAGACFHRHCGCVHHLPKLNSNTLWAMPGHKDPFYSLESRERLPWSLASQRHVLFPCEAIPLTAPFNLPRRTLNPKIRSSTQKTNCIPYLTVPRLHLYHILASSPKYLIWKWE